MHSTCNTLPNFHLQEHCKINFVSNSLLGMLCHDFWSLWSQWTNGYPKTMSYGYCVCACVCAFIHTSVQTWNHSVQIRTKVDTCLLKLMFSATTLEESRLSDLFSPFPEWNSNNVFKPENYLTWNYFKKEFPWALFIAVMFKDFISRQKNSTL